MIPEAIIDQVREATDIVQVIGGYLRLKKRGRNHVALCPFHTEKTPSFNVSEDRQIFHCFGCGKGGNVFTFLMEHEAMSFVEAVRHLARQANIRIPEAPQSDYRREKLERLNFANQTALEYFRKTLRERRYRRVLDEYLLGRRNMTEETVEHFSLGLAGTEWDGLIDYAKSKDISPEELEQAGLAIKSEKKGNYFDRFRHRLMIPIFNLSHKPIAFGGRTLRKGEPAKYVNSPETPLYTKGNVLYGLNFARDRIRNENAAIVVEGYFDVISLWQVGIRNVVASSGTAFTSQQARLLARFADEVYLFFDADSAGQQAAVRSVDALYDAGMEVKVVMAPPGEDPDTIARTGGVEAVEELMAQALDYIRFRVREIDVMSLGIIGREKLIKELGALGSRIGDQTRRRLFIEEAASALQIDPDLLLRNVNVSLPESASSPRRRRSHDPDEFDLVSLLLSDPPSAGWILEKVSPEDFDSRQLSRVYAAAVNQHNQRGQIDVGRLTADISDNDFVSLVTELASREWPTEEIDNAAEKLVGAILEAKRKRLRGRLQKQLTEAEAAGDREEADRLLREIKSFSEGGVN